MYIVVDQIFIDIPRICDSYVIRKFLPYKNILSTCQFENEFWNESIFGLDTKINILSSAVPGFAQMFIR